MLRRGPPAAGSPQDTARCTPRSGGAKYHLCLIPHSPSIRENCCELTSPPSAQSAEQGTSSGAGLRFFSCEAVNRCAGHECAGGPTHEGLSHVQNLRAASTARAV